MNNKFETHNLSIAWIIEESSMKYSFDNILILFVIIIAFIQSRLNLSIIMKITEQKVFHTGRGVVSVGLFENEKKIVMSWIGLLLTIYVNFKVLQFVWCKLQRIFQGWISSVFTLFQIKMYSLSYWLGHFELL